jgi:hypothetical protein
MKINIRIMTFSLCMHLFNYYSNQFYLIISFQVSQNTNNENKKFIMQMQS